MAPAASFEDQLVIAEKQEAKLRAEEVALKAALNSVKAARVEFGKEAQRLRQKIARTSRRGALGQGPPPKGSPPAAPVLAQAPPKKMGRPRLDGCFQCRFLARAGAVGRRGGKKHTCGGPGSAEYLRWERVRLDIRAKTQSGKGVPVRGKSKKAAVSRK